MNTYNSAILTDSISQEGVRLTTMQVTFPRFILAEVNTHRMFSRNSASSRAIPTEKQIERVIKDPFVPETFNKRVKGMGVGAALDVDAALASKKAWLHARDKSVQAAVVLNDIGVDKSRVNRLLEPFLWHTAIISATEWLNFFALRDHPDAQPEFQIVARLMREAMEDSVPLFVKPDEWHMPLTSDFPMDSFDGNWEPWKKISAGRCARVSYDTQDNYEEHEVSIKRADVLSGNGHFSPSEHVARPFTQDEWYAVREAQAAIEYEYARRGEVAPANLIDQCEFRGNFRGWVQMRKEITNEADFGMAMA